VYRSWWALTRSHQFFTLTAHHVCHTTQSEDRMAHAYAAAQEFANSQGRSSISMEEAAEIGAGLGMRTGIHVLKEDGQVSPAAKMVMGDKF
jgi:hypothetical protein